MSGEDGDAGSGGGPQPVESGDGSDRSGLERLVLFSDAIFAIAITLLAIDIRSPETLPFNTNAALVDSLVDLVPAVAAYALSFMAIASFWVGHHRTFRVTTHMDTGLVVLNLVFLAFVALLPFPTSVIARHGDLVAAVVFYALFLAVTAALSTALFIYPVRAGLVLARVTPEIARHITYRSALVPLIFLFSIPSPSLLARPRRRRAGSWRSRPRPI